MADQQVRDSLPNLTEHIFGILNPQICDGDEDEEAKATSGQPTGSKPAKVAAKVLEPVPKPAEVPPLELPEKPPATPNSEVDVVNSSTHRKEHARLTRRVASMDPAKFPEVHRMWGGNRKDTIIFSFACFHRTFFVFPLHEFRLRAFVKTLFYHVFIFRVWA